MDPAYPVLNGITNDIVFPLSDVLHNSWAIIPKASNLEYTEYLPGSRAIYDNAVYIGDIGPMLLYSHYKYRLRGAGLSWIYALTQLGTEILPHIERPIQFWIPIFSTRNHTWKLSEECCERYYHSRGWLPFKDVMGDVEMWNPLPRKWVRLGLGQGEDRLVTHEPEDLPFTLPTGVRLARVS